jgi:hypothetical protein
MLLFHVGSEIIEEVSVFDEEVFQPIQRILDQVRLVKTSSL